MKDKKQVKKAIADNNKKPLKANTTMKIDASFQDAMKALIKPKKAVKKNK